MAMKVSREEFLGVDQLPKPSFENVAAKMALDFEAGVFMRLNELKLKRKDLARLLGVSPAAVSKILSENSNMTLKTMAKIAVALGCEISSVQLKSVSDVSYIDLNGEEETVSAIVPKEITSDAIAPETQWEKPIQTSGPAQPKNAIGINSTPVFKRIAA